MIINQNSDSYPSSFAESWQKKCQCSYWSFIASSMSWIQLILAFLGGFMLLRGVKYKKHLLLMLLLFALTFVVVPHMTEVDVMPLEILIVAVVAGFSLSFYFHGKKDPLKA